MFPKNSTVNRNISQVQFLILNTQYVNSAARAEHISGVMGGLVSGGILFIVVVLSFTAAFSEEKLGRI